MGRRCQPLPDAFADAVRAVAILLPLGTAQATANVAPRRQLRQLLVVVIRVLPFDEGLVVLHHHLLHLL
eukprot:1898718-Prymnesium_polylepis.2